MEQKTRQHAFNALLSVVLVLKLERLVMLIDV